MASARRAEQQREQLFVSGLQRWPAVPHRQLEQRSAYNETKHAILGGCPISQQNLSPGPSRYYLLDMHYSGGSILLAL